MKLDVQIEFTISWGRKRLFVLDRLLPFLKKLRQRHKAMYIGCYRKTRFPSRQSALNCEWFKKNKVPNPNTYHCQICEGWHLTSKEGDK